MKKTIFGVAALMAIFICQAGGTFSLIEINPLHGNSPLTATSDSSKTYYGAGELSGFTEMNGKLYFSAQSTPGDDELWVTDGTVQGTSMVKAINPGHGAGIGNLVYVNNHLVFMATDNGTSWDLWSTDGTDAGTVKIDVLTQPSNTALGPYNSSIMGNRLLFCSIENLLITDGTAIGTDSLLSIAGYSQGFGYCENDGQSYFILPEISGANDIWRSDGTAAGSLAVLGLDTTSFNITSVKAMMTCNGKIYLSATQSGQAPDMFSFDGNLNGKLNRIAIAAVGNSSPHSFTLYDSALYFIANNGTSANIYRISPSDSTPVALIPNANFSSLNNLSFANNTAYCLGPDNKSIYSLELTGLNYNAFPLTGYYFSALRDTNKAFLTGLNGQIFFEAYDSTTGNQVLIQSDLTPAGTAAMMPPSANTTHPFNSKVVNGVIEDVFDLRTWGNKILLPANFDSAGRELWVFDPGTSGIEDVKADALFTIYPNPSSSELTVKTNISNGEIQQLNITNVYGQIVINQTLEKAVSTIDVSSLVTGAYFVSINQKEVQKLIVVK